MTSKTSARSHERARVSGCGPLAVAIIAALTGCAEVEVGAEMYKTYAGTTGEAAPQLAAQGSPQPAMVDSAMYPDPSAFRDTGFALWDGAQTLNGLWITHPEAQTARRVRITNEETGTQVDAGMFLRDSNHKGPRIVVSSGVAEALALTPGHATAITITGLAHGIAAAAGNAAPGNDFETEVPAPFPVLTHAVPAGPAPQAPASEARVAAAQIAEIPAAEIPAAAQPDPAPAIEAPPSAPALEPAGPDAPVQVALAETAPAPATDPGIEAPVASPVPAAEPLIAASQLAPAAETPIASASADGGASSAPAATPVAAPAAAPVAKPVVAPDEASDRITDGRHFIQVGIFGLSANATQLVAKLRAADLPADELPMTLNGRPHTRVIVGPYETVAERKRALEIIRRIGPADAMPVRG